MQPELAKQWLHGDPQRLTGISEFLFDRQQLLLIPILLPFMVLVYVRRLAPTAAAALLWSVLVVFNAGFAFQYVVWALPFVLMAGYL